MSTRLTYQLTLVLSYPVFIPLQHELDVSAF